MDSLRNILDFLAIQIEAHKVVNIRDKILTSSESLAKNPYLGQIEILLAHLNLDHRRIIIGNYKIIYRIQGNYIYITDIFDSRQDPKKMKS